MCHYPIAVHPKLTMCPLTVHAMEERMSGIHFTVVDMCDHCDTLTAVATLTHDLPWCSKTHALMTQMIRL